MSHRSTCCSDHTTSAQAELDLTDSQDQLSELQANYTAATIAKRKLEGEVQSLHTDLDDMLNEAKSSEEKAKKAMVDAARWVEGHVSSSGV